MLLGDVMKLRQDSLTLVNLALHVFANQKLSTICRGQNSIIGSKISELQEGMPESHTLFATLGDNAQTVPPQARQQ